MIKLTEEHLEEFARLAIEVGVNLQKGQPLEIRATVAAVDLVRRCVKIAYERGASYVNVIYDDDTLNRLDYEYKTEEVLCEVPDWTIERIKYNIDKGYCRLIIEGTDPDLFKGLDGEKIQKATIARLKATKPYQYYSMNNIGQWCIIAYPNKAWAEKVFPDKSKEEAYMSLFDAILSTSRIEKGKTIDNWRKHNEEIHEHCKVLNEYNFKSLHFTNSLGTDLRVGLIKDHIWEGGDDLAHGKFPCRFNPNIPTEEVFTMPDRYHIDGKVYSTKPLSYNGKIIPEFNLTFKDGKIVDYDAKENKETLKNLIETDEGTKSLGEVALISHDSPISKSGILFYNTLFDENASCHLAIGDCYPTNVKGGSEMDKEELYKLGGNSSMEHVDFMFGSADLSVVGETYDGKEIVVFKEGNFVF